MRRLGCRFFVLSQASGSLRVSFHLFRINSFRIAHFATPLFSHSYKLPGCGGSAVQYRCGLFRRTGVNERAKRELSAPNGSRRPRRSSCIRPFFAPALHDFAPKKAPHGARDRSPALAGFRTVSIPSLHPLEARRRRPSQQACCRQRMNRASVRRVQNPH